ncbi:hypothetical protein Ancab_018579 [Ancistrocladus abbreviatus]
MARPIQLQCCSHSSFSSLPLAIGLFVTVTALVALCAKRAANKIPKKYESIGHGDESSYSNELKSNDDNNSAFQVPKSPRSPLATPKKMLTTISNKTIPFINNKKNGEGWHEEGFGEGGLWQKNILMGDKCRPLQFSGVIYYDHLGNQISEIPRSPRAANSLASAFPFSSFPVPVVSNK